MHLDWNPQVFHLRLLLRLRSHHNENVLPAMLPWPSSARSFRSSSRVMTISHSEVRMLRNLPTRPRIRTSLHSKLLLLCRACRKSPDQMLPPQSSALRHPLQRRPLLSKGTNRHTRQHNLVRINEISLPRVLRISRRAPADQVRSVLQRSLRPSDLSNRTALLLMMQDQLPLRKSIVWPI